MGRRVNVIGVGMTKFAKPGQSEDYHVMASKAAHAALRGREDPLRRGASRRTPGYVYGDSTCGQRALYEVGLTGIPVFNVNNNCSTGSTALMLGKQAIEGGLAECVLVVGFEKMEKGALGVEVHRPREPRRQARPGDDRRAGLQPGAADGADVRRRGPRVPLEVRREEGDLRARSARRRASTRRTTRTRSSTSCSRSRRSWPARRSSTR